jgi:tyrosyl-tRNA synthetase
LTIKTKEGKEEFHSINELTQAYTKGKIHPLDLKNSISEQLIIILGPVKKYFEKNEGAKKLFEVVKGYEITR